jgi:hypothetical protein
MSSGKLSAAAAVARRRASTVASNPLHWGRSVAIALPSAGVDDGR